MPPHLKRIWLLLAAMISLGAVTSIVVTRHANQEVDRPLESIGAAGEGPSVLVVFHPGLSEFPESVARTVGRGIRDEGGHAVLATASREGAARIGSPPTSGYDLLVVVSPVYWFGPSRPVRRWLRGAGELDGIPTVAVVTGSGSGERALRILRDRLRSAGARVIETATAYTFRPNGDAEPSSGETNRARGAEQVADTVIRALGGLR